MARRMAEGWGRLLVIGALLLGSAPGPAGGESTQETVVVVTGDGGAGKEFTGVVGQAMSLELESPGATGYRWTVMSFDEEIVGVREVEALVGGEPGMVGAPVRKRWVVTLLKPGSTTLRLELARPWESEKPARIHEVRITVREREGGGR